MYDRVLVSDSAKASVPSPVYLSRFVGRNGLNSKSVMVADSKTVVVKGFTFRGLAPGKKIIQLRLCECCMQAQAEVVSNSGNKIHQT